MFGLSYSEYHKVNDYPYFDYKWEREPETNYPNIGIDIRKARKYRNNLNKALNEGLEEFFDSCKEYKINGKKWFIHKNVNLYLDITTNCPFNCGFCIAKTNDGRNGNIKIEDITNNFHKLEDAGVNFTCQITGGEPNLHPDLLQIRDICGKRKTVINTNFPNNKMSTFDYINVSCHHYNSQIEKEIFNGIRDKSKLKIDITFIKDKIRLQGLLLGGYIDTFGEISQYIAYGYHYLGITSFAFSFLTILPKNIMYKDEIIDYVKEKPCVTFNEVAKELEKRNHWKFLKYRSGVACYYEVWEYLAYEKPITVIFKYSNNHILHKLDKMSEYIPDIIIHPNGKMTASWDQRIKEI
jgi:hypothetical protein